jgi:hypothetical protein
MQFLTYMQTYPPLPSNIALRSYTSIPLSGIYTLIYEVSILIDSNTSCYTIIKLTWIILSIKRLKAIRSGCLENSPFRIWDIFLAFVPLAEYTPDRCLELLQSDNHLQHIVLIGYRNWRRKRSG